MRRFVLSTSLASVILLSALSVPVLGASHRSLRRQHHRSSGPPAPPPTGNPPVGVGADVPAPAVAAAADDRAGTPPVAADALTFTQLQWTSEEGQIRVNNQPFHLKGVAWFGMEDDGATLHGLDKKPMGTVLDFLTKQGFNAIRFTVSLDFALRLQEPIPSYDYLRKLMDKDLWELNRGQLLSKVIDKVADRGFLVLLDMHRLSLYDQGELWYGLGYTEDDLIKGWDNLLAVVGSKWNVFGLDLKNEPRGRATWGTGELDTDWALAATRISQSIIKNHPEYRGLFFVEGVENPTGTWQTSTGRWWGGDIEGVKVNPIDLGSEDDNKRVVYAPHIYGPGQYMMDYFMQSDFPTNLPDVFKDQWGFAENLTGRAVVIGEWGGNVGQKGTVVGEWASALVSYLVQSCIADTFFWSLNPDSMDTGGLLKADWGSADTDKLVLLDRLQPHPSRLTPSRPTSAPATTTATKDAAAAAAAVAAMAAAERTTAGAAGDLMTTTFTLTPGRDGNPLCAATNNNKKPPARA